MLSSFRNWMTAQSYMHPSRAGRLTSDPATEVWFDFSPCPTMDLWPSSWDLPGALTAVLACACSVCATELGQSVTRNPPPGRT